MLIRLLVCLLALFAYGPRAIARDAQPPALAFPVPPGFDTSRAGRPAPAIPIIGKAGPVSLAAFKGKAVVLNLWATWCAPCLKEMPQLDALATAMKGKDAVVLTVSEDMGGWRDVDPWWARARLKTLTPYLDKRSELALALGAKGLPLTILYDRQGREVARLATAADWSSPWAVNLVTAISSRP